MKQVTRRSFLASTIGATSLAALTVNSAAGVSSQPVLTDSFTILFQGDSITDGNRGRNTDPNHILGHGYAFSIASMLGSKYPERKLSFVNKGVSGDKISDLASRWQADAIDLKPDLVSILVGINDIHAEINHRKSNAAFESQYRQVLDETTRALPDALIVLAEPFILAVGMVNNDPEKWKTEVVAAQQAVRKLVKEYDALLIPYQQMFNDACKFAPAEYWIWDGIHPTYNGHGLMASLWMKTVGEKCALVADK